MDRFPVTVRFGGLSEPEGVKTDLFLSTLELSGIQAFEPAEGVCRAAAGTRLAPLREVVLAEGWELPLDGERVERRCGPQQLV